MASLDELVEHVASQGSVEEAIERLVTGLAERVKATSNDQNIQKLSRELLAVKSALVRSVARKAAQSNLK